MRSINTLIEYFPSSSDVLNTAASIPFYASRTATFAYDVTAQSALSKYQKTKDGISSVKDAIGLLQATYRTIRGIGEVIENEGKCKPLPFPASWTQESVIAGDHETTICKMSVDKAIGTYIFAMGHGTESAYYKPWIERVNARGYNVVTIELPEPEHNDYFANGERINEGYEAIIADTVLNPASAVYRDIPVWHTISLLTHSASGQAFESALRKDDHKVDFAQAMFGDRIFHSGIMLDTAHSSLRHAWLFSVLYDCYSQFTHVRDKKAGTTEADRFWIREELEVASNHYATTMQVNVTHAQAYALKHGGIDLVRSVKNPKKLSEAFKNLKRTIIMGLDETSACPKTGKDYADHLPGAEFIGIEEVKHNPLMECAKAYAIVARNTVPYTKERFRALQESVKQASASEKIVPALKGLEAI
jgi:hypothetical protein